MKKIKNINPQKVNLEPILNYNIRPMKVHHYQVTAHIAIVPIRPNIHPDLILVPKKNQHTYQPYEEPEKKNSDVKKGNSDNFVAFGQQLHHQQSQVT
jgi:hypothetical protein